MSSDLAFCAIGLICSSNFRCYCRRRLKKAFRSMAKSQPMIPSNNNNDKAPKTTLLDGGFFGQRKHRNHGVINEKQIKREEKRDKSILCCVCFDETFCVEVEIGDEMDDISVNSADGEHNLAGGTSICMPTEQACCGGLYSAARTTIKILRMDREFQRIAALMLPVSLQCKDEVIYYKIVYMAITLFVSQLSSP